MELDDEDDAEYANEDETEYVFDPGSTVIIEIEGGVVQDTSSPNGIEPLIVDRDVHPDATIEYFEQNGVQWGKVIWGREA